MPLDIQRLEDGGLIVTGRGIVTGSDFVEHAKRAGKIRETESIRYQLVDWTKAEGIDLTKSDMQRMTALLIDAVRVNGQLHVAIVGDRDLFYGIARMWQSSDKVTNERVMVFRNMPDAKKWLQRKTGKPAG